MIFVAGRFAGFRIPGLGDSKRLQLAAGCLHLVLEHGQSIVVLTQDKCFGSALALQRPLHETFCFHPPSVPTTEYNVHRSLWTNADFLESTGSGIRAADRVPVTVAMGRRFFG